MAENPHTTRAVSAAEGIAKALVASVRHGRVAEKKPQGSPKPSPKPTVGDPPTLPGPSVPHVYQERGLGGGTVTREG